MLKSCVCVEGHGDEPHRCAHHRPRSSQLWSRLKGMLHIAQHFCRMSLLRFLRSEDFFSSAIRWMFFCDVANKIVFDASLRTFMKIVYWICTLPTVPTVLDYLPVLVRNFASLTLISLLLIMLCLLPLYKRRESYTQPIFFLSQSTSLYSTCQEKTYLS